MRSQWEFIRMLKARQTGVMITRSGRCSSALPEHLPILSVEEVPATLLVKGCGLGVSNVAVASCHDLRSDSGGEKSSMTLFTTCSSSNSMRTSGEGDGVGEGSTLGSWSVSSSIKPSASRALRVAFLTPGALHIHGHHLCPRPQSSP